MRLAFPAIALSAALTAACSSGSGSAGGHASATVTSSPDSSAAVSCAAGALELVGSSAFLPIAQDAAAAYMHDCPGATITVSGGDSAYGLTKVGDAVKSGSSSAGSMIAMYDGLPSAAATAGLRPYPMGVLIFSVVAHNGLIPAADISTAQLRKIFVKPGEQGKVAVGRRAGSGSRQAFDTNVLGFNPGPPDKGNCPVPTGAAFSFTSCTEDSTADLLGFVSKTPDAIGYAELFGSLASYPQAAVISIDNAAPTPADVRNGSYKFWTVEHLYTGARLTSLARDFLGFLPRYRATDPPADFIPCSEALQSLGAAC